LAALLLAAAWFCRAAATGRQRALDPAKLLVELTAEDLQSNLDFWRQDMAVMFYAP
jgi:hypothetical protein